VAGAGVEEKPSCVDVMGDAPVRVPWPVLSDTDNERSGGTAAAVLLAGFGRLASTGRIGLAVTCSWGPCALPAQTRAAGAVGEMLAPTRERVFGIRCCHPIGVAVNGHHFSAAWRRSRCAGGPPARLVAFRSGSLRRVSAAPLRDAAAKLAGDLAPGFRALREREAE